jgi:hypothetical protein
LAWEGGEGALACEACRGGLGVRPVFTGKSGGRGSGFDIQGMDSALTSRASVSNHKDDKWWWVCCWLQLWDFLRRLLLVDDMQGIDSVFRLRA